MKIEQLDVLAGRLARVGVAGGLPKEGPQSLLVDELQRQLGALKDAVSALLTNAREGPRFGLDSDLFLIDCRPGLSTSNILTTAQATTEGLGAVDGLAIYRHGKGYALDRYVEVAFAMNNRSIAVVNGQQQRSGRLLLYKYDSNRTVFQVDDDAQLQETWFLVSCYSRKPPPASVNKGREAESGASAPQLGTVTASIVLPPEIP